MSYFRMDNVTDSSNPNSTTPPQVILKLYRIHKGMNTGPKELGVIIAVMVFCASFNTRCIYKLCQRKRLRAIDYLLGNLSFAVIFVCCIGTLLFTNMVNFLPLSPQGKCSVTNYLKYLSGSLASTASFAISYERLCSLDRLRHKRNGFTLTTWKLIFVVWISGIGIILPTLLTSVTPPESLANLTSSAAPCWRVPLLYSKFFDIWYELVKYVLFHLAFTVCVFTELYVVRSKLKYLCWQQTGARSLSLKSKVNRVRCAFIQSVLFIILWNAVGLSNVIYTVYTWYSFNNQLILSTLLGLMKAVGYIYSMINPMLLVYSNQSPKFWPVRCSRLNCYSKTNINIQVTNQSEVVDENKTQEIASDDVSRFATRLNPSDSILRNNSDQENCAIELCELRESNEIAQKSENLSST